MDALVTAPCYDEGNYWRFFERDYSGLRILDLGSSVGSLGRTEFRTARASIGPASKFITVDIRPGAKPNVCADAHSLPIADGALDVIIANNVLEHLRDPSAVVQEIRRVLAPEGVLLFTVPFLYPVHEAPNDYVRYTEFGLRQLFGAFTEVDIRRRGGFVSTMAQFGFLLTRSAERFRLGGLLRALLRPVLAAIVQLDRWDTSGAFVRAYYGEARR